MISLELLEKIKKELDDTSDPISFLIVINDMWWERFYKHRRNYDIDIPKEIDANVKRKARSLYVFLDLDDIKSENEWISLMTLLVNHYKKKYKEEELIEDWKPLDL
jgi:hypothetical protein